MKLWHTVIWWLGVASLAHHDLVRVHVAPWCMVPSAIHAPFSSLYDGARPGETPDRQGFEFIRYNLTTFDPKATQTWADGATTLDTWAVAGDAAVYRARPAALPPLDRAAGFTVRVVVQVLREEHTSPDRAGWSITALGSDARGIELGFWEGSVWAQEGGAPPALFTRAEHAAFDTTRGLVAYELTVRGDRYTLTADGTPLLSGPVRDYGAFAGPLDPYETPNFLALSDNTSSARATVRLAAVAVGAGHRQFLPLISRT